MKNVFNCSACGAPLIYPAGSSSVRCPYCRATIMAPDELRLSSGSSGKDSRKPIRDHTLNAIARLAGEGREAEAVNVILQNLGVGRDRAEKAVKRLAAGKPAQLGDMVLQPIARRDTKS